MIASTCARGSPLRRITRSIWTSTGQSTTSTRSSQLRQVPDSTSSGTTTIA